MTRWSSADIRLLESLLPPALVQSLQQPDPSPQTVRASWNQLSATLNTILPFVPTPVADHYLTYTGAERSEGRYLTGAVLCAEISGFTNLSSELAGTGPQGSEELSAIVNRLCAMLLAEVQAHGGSMLRFGGDALTAFFDAGMPGGGHGRRAAAAALAMQARMADDAVVTTSRGEFELRLRVAVHSGRMFVAEVGDERHAELVYTGRMINRAMVALESAAPGEAIVSDETVQTIDGAETEPRSNGIALLRSLPAAPLPQRPAPVWQPGPPDLATLSHLARAINALQPYAPHNLPERFARSDAEGGEFRPVTVLFANFYAFSRLLALLEFPALVERDAGIVGRVLNTYYTHIQSIIHHYGGSINRIDMATFGNRLMALFGAPLAHEDDAVRAVQAAMTLRAAHGAANDAITSLLRDWIEEHPDQRQLLRVVGGALRQRVGITSGTVFAGIVGTPQRREYTVIGETVTLAARLLSAVGSVTPLLTSRVQRAVDHLFETQPLTPLIIRGFSWPVPVFRVMQEREASAPDNHTTPFVGRRRELAQVQELARVALQGPAPTGRVGEIVGDPGIGKSRLVAEALRNLPLDEPPLIGQATCQSYEQTTPYALIARLLRQILALPATEDREVQAVYVQQQINELVPTWSRFGALLGPLLNLPLPETDLTLALTAEQRYERLHDLVIIISQALARRQPLIIVCDDLQWVDESSRSIIERLAFEMADLPLLLLLIYRPLPAIAAPWRELEYCTTIALRELSREESRMLLQALLQGDLPPELKPLIRRTYGTPFYLEETVRYLLESAAIERNTEGRWISTRPIDSNTVPSRVEQLLVARLDRLPEGARDLAQVAAVIGQHFSEELLASVSAQPETLARRLGELSDAGLIVPDDNGAQASYTFRHILLRDVAYDSMLFARRRELHAQVAAALEQIAAETLDEQRVVLAQHYRRAGLPDQAFPHFLQAAQQAQARYANSEALALYNQTLATAPWRDEADRPADPQAAAAIHTVIGDIHALTGNYAEARWHYEWSLLLLEQRGQWPAQQAALQRKIGSTHEHQGAHDDAVEWLGRANQTIAAARPDATARLEHARILSDNGWLHFRRGDLDAAQQQLEQALALVETQNAAGEEARILNRLGGVAWQRGDLDRARRAVEQSLAASTRSGDLAGQASALNNLGSITGSQGLLEESTEYCLQAMAINEQVGSRREMAIMAVNTGCAFYDRDEFKQAHRYFLNGLEYATEIRDTYHQMLALLNLGRALTALGQGDEARQAILRSQYLAIQLHLVSWQLDSFVALGELELRQQQIAAAEQAFRQGATLVTAAESEEYGRLQRLEARIAITQGDREQAIELLSANAALFARLQNVPEAQRTQRLLAETQAGV